MLLLTAIRHTFFMLAFAVFCIRCAKIKANPAYLAATVMDIKREPISSKQIEEKS